MVTGIDHLVLAVPDLDSAAVKVAKATRYAAGTEGGSALPESCIKFKVKFVLKNN